MSEFAIATVLALFGAITGHFAWYVPCLFFLGWVGGTAMNSLLESRKCKPERTPAIGFSHAPSKDPDEDQEESWFIPPYSNRRIGF